MSVIPVRGNHGNEIYSIWDKKQTQVHRKASLEQNVQNWGKYEFDYTHEKGRDDDVRISFEVPKGQERKDSVCITSVSFMQVNN